MQYKETKNIIQQNRLTEVLKTPFQFVDVIVVLFNEKQKI